MIFEPASDFSAVLAAMPTDHRKRRILRLLEEAVRRDIHFIARHPTAGGSSVRQDMVET